MLTLSTAVDIYYKGSTKPQKIVHGIILPRGQSQIVHEIVHKIVHERDPVRGQLRDFFCSILLAYLQNSRTVDQLSMDTAAECSQKLQALATTPGSPRT